MLESASFTATKPRTAEVVLIVEGLGNKRDLHYYPASTLRKAVKDRVFESVQAFLDHPSKADDRDRPERSLRDLIGWYSDIKEVRMPDGKVGIGATLHIRDGADEAVGLIKEALAHAAKYPDQPPFAGLSINSDGEVERENVDGQILNVVKSVGPVFSVDCVTRPARAGKFLSLSESESAATRKSESMQDNTSIILRGLVEAEPHPRIDWSSFPNKKAKVAAGTQILLEGLVEVDARDFLREASGGETNDAALLKGTVAEVEGVCRFPGCGNDAVDDDLVEDGGDLGFCSDHARTTSSVPFAAPQP
jgi:hypothetical protein